VYEVCDELGETLREHNKVASVLERAVQNSNEENKPGFRLAIKATRQIDGSTAHLFYTRRYFSGIDLQSKPTMSTKKTNETRKGAIIMLMEAMLPSTTRP